MRCRPDLLTLLCQVVQNSPAPIWNRFKELIRKGQNVLVIPNSRIIEQVINEHRVEAEKLAAPISEQAELVCNFIDTITKSNKLYKIPLEDTNYMPGHPSLISGKRFWTSDGYEFYKFEERELNNLISTTYNAIDREGNGMSVSKPTNGAVEIILANTHLPYSDTPIIEITGNKATIVNLNNVPIAA